MTTRDGIAAIPTVYAGVKFRSRLEAKWASFFDKCGWRWSYESADLCTPGARIPTRIPDFVMTFAAPTILECKPAFTYEELADWRRGLVETAASWLCVEAERALRALDVAPAKASDLARADVLIEHITTVRDRHQNPSTGRSALVVGSILFECGDVLAIDDAHTLTECSSALGHSRHIGLRDTRGRCLVCDNRNYAALPADASHVMSLWRSAGNDAQWHPPR